MRATCLKEIHQLARQDSRVVFVGSDLGSGTLDALRKEFPERFFMEGISEQHLLGLAAGMAMDGWIVYVNTISSFLVRRALDQLIVDCCLQNLPVRLVGNGGGVVYAPLGPTHEIIEDLAVLRAVPNMSVLVPADAEEMSRLMPQTLNWPGPLYIRLAKGYDPIVSSSELPAQIGKGVPLARGRDVLLVTTGITLGIARAARSLLASEGVDAGILHLHTVKPLDAALLLDMATPVRAVLTVEEHSILGGLGGAVAELLAEWDGFDGKRFRRLGLPDAFPDRYGSQASLMEYYGLTPERLAGAARELCL